MKKNRFYSILQKLIDSAINRISSPFHKQDDKADEKKKRYNRLYLDLAKRIAEMSFCERMTAGAIVVKDDNILAFGFNGAPSGMPNVCEDETNTTLPYVLHAEENLFLKLSRSNESCEGATIYITQNPCIRCARMIHQVKIKEVFYEEDYRTDEGTQFLLKCGVPVYKVDKLLTL